MVKIRQNLVPASLINKISYGIGNKKTHICVHETDNTRSGSDADAHSRLQRNGNSRQASWHWQVDDVEAVQSFTHDVRCWAAGTNGNNEAIHVEICVNGDGNYQKAVQNAAALVAKIMKDEGIPASRVVQHSHYTGKNCPRIMRGGKIPWSTFMQMVKGSGAVAQAAVKPSDNKRYRLFTGTYGTLAQAENTIDVMKHRFGWVCYTDKVNGLWRVKTGTFLGKNVAEQAAQKIKAAELSNIVHIIEE